jgi:hypothetical protein
MTSLQSALRTCTPSLWFSTSTAALYVLRIRRNTKWPSHIAQSYLNNNKRTWKITSVPELLRCGLAPQRPPCSKTEETRRSSCQSCCNVSLTCSCDRELYSCSSMIVVHVCAWVRVCASLWVVVRQRELAVHHAILAVLRKVAYRSWDLHAQSAKSKNERRKNTRTTQGATRKRTQMIATRALALPTACTAIFLLSAWSAPVGNDCYWTLQPDDAASAFLLSCACSPKTLRDSVYKTNSWLKSERGVKARLYARLQFTNIKTSVTNTWVCDVTSREITLRHFFTFDCRCVCCAISANAQE